MEVFSGKSANLLYYILNYGWDVEELIEQHDPVVKELKARSKNAIGILIALPLLIIMLFLKRNDTGLLIGGVIIIVLLLGAAIADICNAKKEMKKVDVGEPQVAPKKKGGKSC